MSWGFERHEKFKAAKIHKCCWCWQDIVKGEKHYHQIGIFNGDWNDWRMHLDCHDVSDPGEEEYLCENKHDRGKNCSDCDNSLRLKASFTGNAYRLISTVMENK